jgi:hypothetical protein
MSVAANSTTPNLSLTGFADDYRAGGNTASGCRFFGGLDRAFSVLVPAGNRLTLTVFPTATLDPTLSVFTSLSACSTSAPMCAASIDRGDPESVSWANTTSSAVIVYFVVDGFSAASSVGTFSLQVDVGPAPADDVCAGATPLSSGVPQLNQSIIGYADDYSGSGTQCASSVMPDRAYSFTVPANQRTTVTVTPNGTTDVRLNLVPGPASTCSMTSPRVCTAGTNHGAAGQVELLSWFNTTASSAPYFAVVDATAAGSFSIVAVTGTPIANDTPSNRVCEDTADVGTDNQPESPNFVNGGTTPMTAFFVAGDLSTTATDSTYTLTASITP